MVSPPQSVFGNKVPVMKFLSELVQSVKLGAFQKSIRLGKTKAQRCLSSVIHSVFFLSSLSVFLFVNHIFYVKIQNVYTVKRLLPFARRRLIILLPDFVDIRFKNPCLRARLILLG